MSNGYVRIKLHMAQLSHLLSWTRNKRANLHGPPHHNALCKVASSLSNANLNGNVLKSFRGRHAGTIHERIYLQQIKDVLLLALLLGPRLSRRRRR